MTAIEDFFIELDQKWTGTKPVELRIIGCGALMLQMDYERGTKDSDVFETHDLTPELQKRLVDLAGRGTELATRRRMFIEIVPNGLPFLPLGARWLGTSLDGRLENFVLKALDVLDVVVAKLARFNANDVTDIDAMCQRGAVPHDVLVQRFTSAYTEWSFDARAADLPRIVGNLHRVERDMLGEAETELDLDSLRY